MNNPIVKNIASGYATYKLIMFILGSVIMIMIGSYIVKSTGKYNNWIQTTATVSKSYCTKSKDSSVYMCKLDLKYPLNSRQEKTTTKSITDEPRVAGDKIDIRVNPNESKTVTVHPIGTLKFLGYMIILIGLLIVGASSYGLNHCLKNDCSKFGAVLGATDTFGMLVNLGSSSDYGIRF